jgi:glycosyltransferase involved in cell wall biosynthesis
MRILLVNDYGTPSGGAEIQIVALRDALRRRGHDARLFATSARPGGGENLADFACLGTTSRYRTLLQTANPWAFRRLRRVLAEFRPDVVHVRLFLTQLSPLILPLLRKVPSLYQPVWYRSICPLGTKMLPGGAFSQARAGAACYRSRCLPLRDWPPLMLQMKLWRAWRHAFNVIVPNSEAVQRRLLAEGIDAGEIIPNGVAYHSPRPPLTSPPTVAFAARLVPEKGGEVLLHAFRRVAAELPTARLLISGDGPERKRLESAVHQWKLSPSVSFLGHLPRAEMERVFEAAWVQAVPSLWEEPFANTALEAMMRGTVVVATHSGDTPQIVRDGLTGMLVPPGDAARLAEALLRLLRDREAAERMGAAGRELALSRFNQEACVDRFIRLYERLVQSQTGAPNG